MLTNTTKSPKSRLLLCAAAVTAIGAAGCAADDMPEVADEAPETLELQAPDSQSNSPDRSGAWFADVRPLGTGCRTGTSQTSISPDGLTFTTTFSEYEAEVDRSKNQQFKDCTLNIKLQSPPGFSVAVSSFYYSGYAYLDEGVRGMQTAKYYFQGFPVPAVEKRTDLVGPMDKSYLFEDKVTTADLVWSPCGATRDLNVVTRVGLYNQVRRNGYINLSAVDASIETKINPQAKLILKFAYRKCDDAPSAPNPNPGSSVDNNNNNNNNTGNTGGGRRGGRRWGR